MDKSLAIFHQITIANKVSYLQTSTISPLRTFSAIDGYVDMIQRHYHNFQTTYWATIDEISHFIKFTLLKSVPYLKIIGSMPSI